MAKRSIAQRLRERGRDVGVAVDEMSRGKAPPKVGRAARPKSTAPKPKRKR